MGQKQKNVTFFLPEDIVDKLRSFVEEDYVQSLNAGVREALEEYTAKLDKIKFMRAMEEASRDPLFLEDIESTMRAFEKADYEIARGIDG